MSVNKHAVFVSLPSWGHTRGMLCFVDTILRIDPKLAITFYHHKSFDKQFQQLSASIDSPKDVLSRLHVVDVQGAEPGPDPFQAFNEVVEKAVSQYDDLVAGKAIESFEALPPPTAFVSDFFGYKVLDHVKEKGSKANTFIWMNGDPCCIPSKHQELIEEKELIEVPDRARLYIWEKHSASGPFPPEMIKGMETAPFVSMAKYGHGHLIAFSRELVPPLTAWEKSVEEQGGHVVVLPPQYPISFWQDTKPSFPVGNPIFNFLNKQTPQSTVFISFGSIFWPVGNPQHVELLVDSLIDAKTPFVISLVTPTFAMTGPRGDVLKEKIDKSGLGIYITEWFDQELLLRHRSVGWVYSHGGVNTLFESLLNGLPLVCHPIAADQADSAALVANQLDCGFEMLQTRDRLKGKKLANHPNVTIDGSDEAVKREFDELWKLTKGKEGTRKRANAKRAGDILRKEHHEKGEAYAREFLALL